MRLLQAEGWLGLEWGFRVFKIDFQRFLVAGLLLAFLKVGECYRDVTPVMSPGLQNLGLALLRVLRTHLRVRVGYNRLQDCGVNIGELLDM